MTVYSKPSSVNKTPEEWANLYDKGHDSDIFRSAMEQARAEAVEECLHVIDSHWAQIEGEDELEDKVRALLEAEMKSGQTKVECCEFPKIYSRFSYCGDESKGYAYCKNCFASWKYNQELKKLVQEPESKK